MLRDSSFFVYRSNRRHLITAVVAGVAALRLGSDRADSHDQTPTPVSTPSPSAAGTKDAVPAGSPAATPVATGLVAEATMRGLKFLPPEIDIDAGTTVVWTNNDIVAHTATHRVQPADQLFSSPILLPGESFSFTFDKPGTYPVMCLPHPFMSQKIVVSEKK